MTVYEYKRYMANRQRILNLNKIRAKYDQVLLEVPPKIKCPKVPDNRLFESAKDCLISI